MTFPYSEEAHRTAREKGFYDEGHDQSIVATKLGLILTEIDEAQDAFNGIPDDKGEISDVHEELADVVIRAADLAGYLQNHEEGYSATIPGVMQFPGMITINEAFQEVIKYVIKMIQYDRKELDDRRRNGELLSRLYALTDAVESLSREILYDTRPNDKLRNAIEKKLSSNNDRPRYHGRRY